MICEKVFTVEVSNKDTKFKKEKLYAGIYICYIKHLGAKKDQNKTIHQSITFS